MFLEIVWAPQYSFRFSQCLDTCQGGLVPLFLLCAHDLTADRSIGLVAIFLSSDLHIAPAPSAIFLVLDRYMSLPRPLKHLY